MNRELYRKLGGTNIRKNKNTYLPFLLSGIAMIAMVYIMMTIWSQAVEGAFRGARSMRPILFFGTIVCGIISVVVLIYTNGFLMKRRAKEFGLYNILGMEKKHIGRVVFWEMAMVGAGSILGGLLTGMLFSRLMFLILLRILRVQTNLSFQISWKVLGLTALFFAGVYLLLIVINAVRIIRFKPLELMKSGKTGEREPKANRLLAVLGILFLGTGYGIAVLVKRPTDAWNLFFIAVLFVIAGTYLVFISGSVAILKLLKRNKKYYYHKKHFITVSGMIYRMRQNALGLATICILSTAVLVTISITVCLYAGVKDAVRYAAPMDVMHDYIIEEEHTGYYSYRGTIADAMKQIKKECLTHLKPETERMARRNGVRIKNLEQFYWYHDVGYMDGNAFCIFKEGEEGNVAIQLRVYILDDYNTLTGETISLNPGEVILSARGEILKLEDRIRIFDKEYKIKEKKDSLPFHTSYDQDYENVLCLVVPDFESLIEIEETKKEQNSDYSGDTEMYYAYHYNLEGSPRSIEAFSSDISEIGWNVDQYLDFGTASFYRNYYDEVQEMYAIYGSLFFIGILIGTMFMLAAVMIIYYKQISEGYDDRERFVIMQKVGMGSDEVKGVIKSQILQVFFLPILLAVSHICFAFPCMEKMLKMMDLNNMPLFIKCTLATLLIFVVLYALVYRLTAKAYYQIVYQVEE